MCVQSGEFNQALLCSENKRHFCPSSFPTFQVSNSPTSMCKTELLDMNSQATIPGDIPGNFIIGNMPGRCDASELRNSELTEVGVWNKNHLQPTISPGHTSALFF